MRYCDGIGHIYCICCLANGKLYIGQTVKSIEKRFKEHKGEKNHFFGKKHSEETRKKMSEAKRRNRYEILV